MHATVHKTFAPVSRPTRDGTSSLKTLQSNPTGDVIALNEPQHLHLDDAEGWSVQALSGIVWITQDGDLRDIVLEPGDTFVLDRAGPALLAPLGDARVLLARQTGRKAHVSRGWKFGIPAMLARARAAIA